MFYVRVQTHLHFLENAIVIFKSHFSYEAITDSHDVEQLNDVLGELTDLDGNPKSSLLRMFRKYENILRNWYDIKW